MLELRSALWLLALPPIVLGIWWLHRLRRHDSARRVAALFLWDGAPQRSGHGAKVARRADPAWWLRAAIAVLLIAALAEPSWRSDAGSLVVWVDDSLSMHAETAGGTRRDRAVERLAEALTAAGHSSVTLRALGDPSAALALSGPAGSWRGQIADWVETLEPREPDWPAPVELDSRHSHWLVTDAAASGLGSWLAEARISRVIDVGEAAGNVAVTRLAARASAAARGRWAGLIEVANPSAAAATRGLALSADGTELDSWVLSLAPGERTQIEFELPAEHERIAARLAGRDALAADDSLELALPPLASGVAVRGACGPSLMRVLAAHPRLRIGAVDPALLVVCGDERSPDSLPTLRVHEGGPQTGGPVRPPAWTAAAADLSALFIAPALLTPLAGPIPDGEPWLYLGAFPAIVLEPGRKPTLHVLLDLEDAQFTATPEYAVLIARLLGALAPEVALDPMVTVARPPPASQLDPEPLPAVTDLGIGAAPSATLLAAPFLAAALLLLALDGALGLRRYLASSRPAVPVPALALKAAVAVGLTVALLRPDWLQGRAPRDLLVLWDDSASIAEEAWAPAWARLSALAATLPRGSRMSVIRFGARPTVEATRSAEALARLADGSAPQPAGRLDRGASELAPAVKSGLRLVEPGRPTAIALMTDGHVDAGESTAWLERTALSGVPIYSLGRPADPAVTMRIQAPTRAPAGVPVPVDVTLGAREEMAGRLSLVVDAVVQAELDLALDAGIPAAVRFELVAPVGARTLQVNWRYPDGALARPAALEISGPAPWLGLSREPDGPSLNALAAAGWNLHRVRPENFTVYADRLGEYAGIVLDDIAIADLSSSDWSRLTSRITEHGGTLLVLGGRNSFGAGGYRHSTLEDVLPVTAEARDPREASAVLFLLDVSGSMGRSLTEADPMAFARRAVLETAASLGANDEVGLIAFDVEARRALPLAAYSDPAAALTASFSMLSPAGGTRLRPALAAALAELSATAIARRMLVLVTDGFVEDEEIASHLDSIDARGIELIALAVGRDADRLALRDLVGNDRLFRVERVSELPQLMRREVERKRRPMQLGESQPRLVSPLPGVPGLETLPPVSGYTRALAKPSATVYLETESGDPLLATQHAGAGRVAALPAGLGEWAANWTESRQWPALGAALGGWLEGRAADAYTAIAIEETGAGLGITIDALATEGGWATDSELRVTVVDPLQAQQSEELSRVAPGRYAGTFEATLPGRHLVSVERGPLGARRAHYRTQTRELDSVQTPSALPAWLSSGLVATAPGRPGAWRFSAGHGPRAHPALLGTLLAALLAAVALPHRSALWSELARWLPGAVREADASAPPSKAPKRAGQ